MSDPISGYTLAQNNVDLSTSNPNSTITYDNVSNIRPLSDYVNGNASITNQPIPQSPQSQTATSGVPLRYPNAQLEGNSDWLEIKIVQYKAPGFNRAPGTFNFATGTSTIRNKESGSLKNPIAYIHLPIPKQLSDGTSVDWGPDRLNPFAGMGAAAVEGLIKNPGDIGKILSDAYNTSITSIKTGELQQGAISAVVSKIVSGVGGNVSFQSALSRSTGTVINPNLELLFNGVNLREFNFTFDFAPRDEFEGQVVKQIIKTIKRSMSAKTNVFGGPGSGLIISAPDVFEIKYKSGNGSHPFLNAFKTCALLDMRLDYTASGNYSTYSDGTPVHTSMTLTFKELNPIYAEDYDEQDAGPGVGY
jgi:hypothetical protein